MKHSQKTNRRGRASLRTLGWLALAATLLALPVVLIAQAPVPANKPASHPAWWFEQEVISRTDANNPSPLWPDHYPADDDFAVANQGQLKWMVKGAYLHLQTKLGQPGVPASITQSDEWTALGNLVSAWEADTENADDYAALNNGQLQEAARHFYDFFALPEVDFHSANVGGWEEGYTYPWQGSSEPGDAYAAANQGQLKNLFAFDFSAWEAPPAPDADGDGLPDWWEVQYGFDPAVVETDLTVDTDGDGLNLLQEAQLGTDPTLADTDGDGTNDGIGVGGFWRQDVFLRTEAQSFLLNDLRSMARYPGNPDESYLVNEETLVMPGELSVELQRGNRARAYLTPEVSGEYTFWVRGEREVKLFLSPDDQSHRKVEIASALNKIKDFDGAASQQSAPVTLQAGQRYYLEVLQNSSRSYKRIFEVAWTPPGAERELLPGQFLSQFVVEDDADDDGLADAWEVANFGSVEAGLANADTDGDLVLNADEEVLGLNPNAADSDGDGVLDTAELGNGLTLGLWHRETDAVINDFVLRPDYPEGPDQWLALPGRKGTPKPNKDLVAVLRGYFVAPQDGDYQFTADPKNNNYQLFLSTDEAPANKVLMSQKRNKWSSAVTLQAGQRYYLEGAFVTTIPTIKWRLDGGSTQKLEPDDVELYPVAQTGAPTLPEGWARADVFPDHGQPHLPGHSEYDEGSGSFVLHSAGDGINDYGDDFHFVYRPQDANARVIVRLTDWYSLDKKHKAGLMLRASLDPSSPHVMVKANANENGVQFIYRDDELNQSAGINFNEEDVPVWLRLDQNGSSVTGYTSQNGATWTKLGTAQVDLGASPLIGLGVTNYIPASNELEWATAVFDGFHMVPDSDGDGVADDIELALGTDINEADSDGDGYSDYEELYELFSDPLMPDLGPAQTVASVTGNTGTAVAGQWQSDGDTVRSQTVNGKIQYTLNVPNDGIYRVEIEAQAFENYTDNDVYPIRVYVDGELVDYVNLYLPVNEIGLAHVATPWLTSGNHTVEIAYDNTMSYRHIQINGVRLQSLGEDGDSNGVEDWVETRLAAMNSIDPVTVSYTSPVSVEGHTRYLALATVSDGTEDYTPQPAPGSGWYANVPLAEDAATNITATFESGGIQDTISVNWAMFNVLAPPAVDDPGLVRNDADVIRLREDDELLLGAVLDGVSTGSTTVTITHTPVGSGTALTPDPITLGATDAEAFAFSEPGTYAIAASHDDGTGNVTNVTTNIEVLRGRFNGNPLVCGLGLYRDWSNPELSPELLIEHDETLAVHVKKLPAEGGIDLRVRADALADSVIAARLDEDGPITGHSVVETITVASNEQTSIDVLETYADGSQLIGTPIIINQITPDMQVDVKIFVAGVTFEDGSVLKTFTAEDFDEFGRIYVKFIKPSDQVTSYCHQILIYAGEGENKVLLGKF